MGYTPKEKKEKKRAAFDFETFGWTPEEGEAQVEVQALSFAYAIPQLDGKPDTEGFLFDSSHERGLDLVEAALRCMARYTQEGKADEWWAHYSHGFDTLHLIGGARRLGWRVEASFGGAGVISADIYPKYKKVEQSPIVIRDLYKVLQSSLKAIAKDFDLPSQKLFTEAEYKGDMRDLPLEQLEAGNLADCRIVREALDKVEGLLKSHGGELRATFSASALTVLKHHLKQNKIRLPQHRERNKRYADANREARAACHGARVEVFEHAPEPQLIEYDFCSMYPWAMTQPMPVTYVGTLLNGMADKAYQAGIEGIYQASVNVPRVYYPPLPYKAESGGLFFPIGKWRAYFTGTELRYAQSLGVEVKIKKALCYERGEPFTTYVNELYELKRNATDGALRQFMKLLLNGSYGKFVERPEREKLVIVQSELEAWMYASQYPGEVRQVDEDIDPCILTREYIRYASHCHYAIGSYITAYARIRLHQHMLQTMGLAYVDTDSLHCQYWNGKTGTALGELKIELSAFKGRYWAPKIYSLHNPATLAYLKKTDGAPHIASKGFPKVDAQTFERMLESARTFRRELKQGASKVSAKQAAQVAGVHLIKTRLLRSMVRGESSDRVLREAQVKTWSGRSMKRRPLAAGGTVPWTVKELKRGVHLKALSPLL